LQESSGKRELLSHPKGLKRLKRRHSLHGYIGRALRTLLPRLKHSLTKSFNSEVKLSLGA
jgi:hypothetical protein